MSLGEQYFKLSGAIDQHTPRLVRESFAQAIADGCRSAHLLIQSNGGLTTSGLQIFYYLRALKLVLTTYNESEVKSAGFMVFISGRQRIGSPNAMYMAHSSIAGKDPKLLTGAAKTAMLKQCEMDNAAILAAIRLSGIVLSNLKMAEFYQDCGADFIAEDALQSGVIHKIGQFQHPAGTIVQSIQDTL